MEAARVHVSETVAEAWNRAGIRYAVATGLEHYPASIGRDLDVLMQVDHIQPALDIARRILREDNWLIAYPPPTWGRRLVAAKEDKWTTALEIHTLRELSWRNVVLADAISLISQVGPFRTDRWVSFVKRILMPLLGGDLGRFRSGRKDLAFEEGEEAVARRRLQKLCGQSLAEDVCAAVAEQHFDALVGLLPHLRRRLVLRTALRSPLTSLQTVSRRFYRKAVQFFAPCAVIVVILGKDAAIDAFVQALREDQSIFTEIILRKAGPHARLARSRNGRETTAETLSQGPQVLFSSGSLFQKVEATLSFFTGMVSTFWEDKKESGRQHLIIYQDYPLEWIEEPEPSASLLEKSLRFISRLALKPDLIFLLEETEGAAAHAQRATLLKRQPPSARRATLNGAAVTDSQQDDRWIRNVIIEQFIKKNEGFSRF